MLKIGEVSKLLDLPVKTIRYWEEFGLFRPSYVDEYTGYRQFSDKDIERLSQIIYLKSLGFELKEIKNLDDKVIAEKTKKLKAEISRIHRNIATLSSLQKDEKGEYIMKNFVNDENAIGHWKLLGLADTEEEAKKLKLRHNHDFKITELYLMEQGQEYWVISWTKGAIFIKNRRNPYEIVGNNMIVALTYDNAVYCYAVYERVDNKKHKVEDFYRSDSMDYPFVIDKKVLGTWKGYDFVDKISDFSPQQKFCKGELFITEISFVPNGELYVEIENGIAKHSYTKGHVFFRKPMNTCVDMEYKIKTINGEEYLFLQWKSGDYQFAGIISGYYVFKREA